MAYASRLLSKSKQNYCVTRRKLLAVVTFCPYLFGWKFTLKTDHGAIAWLIIFKDSLGQLALGWRKFKSLISPCIVHHKGRLHSKADALSRLP